MSRIHPSTPLQLSASGGFSCKRGDLNRFRDSGILRALGGTGTAAYQRMRVGISRVTWRYYFNNLDAPVSSSMLTPLIRVMVLLLHMPIPCSLLISQPGQMVAQLSGELVDSP